MNILLVCTANQCRSPLAKVILERRLSEKGVSATVHSAGLYEGGHPATDDAKATALRAGLDLSQHRSVEVNLESVRGADLVVAMTRHHARELMVLAPEAWDRIFPLKELVRRAEQTGRRPVGQPLSAWLPELNRQRDRSALLTDDPDDDIDDPIGKGPEAYERTYRELDDLLARLVPLMASA